MRSSAVSAVCSTLTTSPLRPEEVSIQTIGGYMKGPHPQPMTVVRSGSGLPGKMRSCLLFGRGQTN
jgi:hypothetical protein